MNKEKRNWHLMGTMALGVLIMSVACKGNQQVQVKTSTDSTEVSKVMTTGKDKEPVITALDVASFGFLGPVQESFVNTYDVTNPDEDQFEKGALMKDDNNETGYAFSEDGQVTADAFGGIYNYDANGKFTKGINAKSVMKRDEKGRVVYYMQKEDDDDDAMFTNEFTYDEKGRIIKIVETYWEWQITQVFTYEGDNIYPSTRRYKRLDEGLEAESETTYRYTKFDEVGNWTERELRYRGSTSEEGETTRWSGANIEVRAIKYY